MRPQRLTGVGIFVVELTLIGVVNRIPEFASQARLALGDRIFTVCVIAKSTSDHLERTSDGG